MALINCPECKKEVSDQSSSCPHCGYKVIPLPTTAEKIGAVGKGMQSCGCLLTIFITIPIILLLFFFL